MPSAAWPRPAIIHGNGRDGQYEQRARSFCLVKAINAALGEDADAGFEREISERSQAPVRPHVPGHRLSRTNTSRSSAAWSTSCRATRPMQSPAALSDTAPRRLVH